MVPQVQEMGPRLGGDTPGSGDGPTAGGLIPQDQEASPWQQGQGADTPDLGDGPTAGGGDTPGSGDGPTAGGDTPGSGDRPTV